MMRQIFRLNPLCALVFLGCVFLASSASTLGQTTAFTYQGRLTDGGTAANGSYDFDFELFDTVDTGTGTQIGQTQNLSGVQISNGIFSVTLDFGANAFPGANRYLQIIVRPSGSTNIPTLLSPRQQLTSTPYAIRSVSAVTADTATNATQLGGVDANQFVLTGDARLSDARPPAPGSSNYIQNTITPQAAANFNISGDGTVGGNLTVGGAFSLNIVNANTQYNLGGARVLSNAGTNNFFAGQGAGQANTTGDSNSFFGPGAGQSNADGRENSFFGRNAGQTNGSGSFNAFYGAGGGLANLNGNNNAFFGYTSGRNNTSGSNNAFVGNAAGFANTNGSGNSFFGFSAGSQNTSGASNNFFGASAGSANTSGFANTFLGTSAGSQNTTGSGNTLIGNGADLGAGNLFNAGAIGAQALVTQPNSLVLGSINGVNGATADTNVGIGTSAPSTKLHVVGDGLFTGNLTVNGNINATFGPGNPNYIQNSTIFQPSSNFNISGDGIVNGTMTAGVVSSTFQYNIGGARVVANPGTNNFFAGQGTGNALTTGTANAFFGATAGALNTSGSQNAFFGSQSGNQNTTGAGNSFFGAQSGKLNTGGLRNSFFGGNAGFNTTTGSDNSYFGVNAGFLNVTGSFNAAFGNMSGQNTTGFFNSFFGYGAGQNTTSGSSNAFFGQNTGNLNATGQENAFFGTQAGAFTNGNNNAFVGTAAGANNQGGSLNTAIGDRAGAASGLGGLQNTTAIGARAWVSTSNSLVLGSINGTNGATADTNVGIGTTAPTARLHVVGDELVTGNLTVNGTINANINSGNFIQNTTTQQASSNFNISGDGTAGGTLSGNVVNATGQYNIAGVRVISNQGTNNFFAGQSAGVADSSGSFNSFFGAAAGNATTTGNDNSFFGENAGKSNTTGTNNTMVGFFSDLGSNDLSNATAIGTRALVTQSNSLVLGSIAGVNGATADTNVGVGTSAPTTRLHVAGDGLFTGNLTVNGTLNVPNAVTASTISASTQYNIGSNRVLSVSGLQNTNTLVGVQAGDANPTGGFNSLFGNGAGLKVTTGANNSFFGSGAGNQTTDGTDNSFFGRNAGFANTATGNSFFGSFAGAANITGNLNAFFGQDTGRSNSDGSKNSFFGQGAGFANTSGFRNSFFGQAAGGANTTGLSNSFFGYNAGNANNASGNAFFGDMTGARNTSGFDNAFFGTDAGVQNTTGSHNSFIGGSTGFNITTGNWNTFLGWGAGSFNNPQNATAIGAQALVAQDNSLVLGSINGANGATADTNVGIGTTAPADRLHISGSGIIRARINSDSNAGVLLTLSDQPKWSVASASGGDFQVFNQPLSQNAIYALSSNNNVGIGTTAPEQRLHVNGNEILSTGPTSGFKFRERSSTSAGDDWTWYGGVVGQAHQARLNHAGTDLFFVDQLGTATVTILRLGLVNNTLGGGQQSLCRDNLNLVGDCSSSLRYKTNIAPFSPGLSFIRQLRPISFDWKAGGMHDVGFGAEDVAKINPTFVTYNKEGQVEGVKYDRLSTVFVNAFNEQQGQITRQQQEIERQQSLLKKQQTQIESLQKLICLDHPDADVCSASPR